MKKLFWILGMMLIFAPIAFADENATNATAVSVENNSGPLLVALGQNLADIANRVEAKTEDRLDVLKKNLADNEKTLVETQSRIANATNPSSKRMLANTATHVTAQIELIKKQIAVKEAQANKVENGTSGREMARAIVSAQKLRMQNVKEFYQKKREELKSIIEQKTEQLKKIEQKRKEIIANLTSKLEARKEKRNAWADEKYGKLKEQLSNRLDNMDDYLSKLTERNITVTDAEAKVAELRLKVEALPANASKEDAKALLEISKQVWDEIVKMARLRAQAFEESRLNDAIEQSGASLQTLENAILKLKAEGEEVSAFEAAISTLKQNLSEIDSTLQTDVLKAVEMMKEFKKQFFSLRDDIKKYAIENKLGPANIGEGNPAAGQTENSSQ